MRPPACLAAAWAVWAVWTIRLAFPTAKEMTKGRDVSRGEKSRGSGWSPGQRRPGEGRLKSFDGVVDGGLQPQGIVCWHLAISLGSEVAGFSGTQPRNGWPPMEILKWSVSRNAVGWSL